MTNTELFEKHEATLMQAARNQRWRKMPPGGKEAIEAGLAVEIDPTWIYSDDARASNGFRLTPLGKEIMLERGFVWKCAGCQQSKFGPTVTDQEYCPVCKAGIGQFGPAETSEGASCKMHARIFQDKKASA